LSGARRAGRDVVDHGRGGSDDFANALFGALHLAASVPAFAEPPIVMPFFTGTPSTVPGGSSLGAAVAQGLLPVGGAYDYERNDSWKQYVNPDGTIRTTPRGRW